MQQEKSQRNFARKEFLKLLYLRRKICLHIQNLTDNEKLLLSNNENNQEISKNAVSKV